MRELHVTPEEFSQLREWSMLPESEFLGNVYARYGRFPAGEEVKVVVDWRSSTGFKSAYYLPYA